MPLIAITYHVGVGVDALLFRYFNEITPMRCCERRVSRRRGLQQASPCVGHHIGVDTRHDSRYRLGRSQSAHCKRWLGSVFVTRIEMLQAKLDQFPSQRMLLNKLCLFLRMPRRYNPCDDVVVVCVRFAVLHVESAASNHLLIRARRYETGGGGSPPNYRGRVVAAGPETRALPRAMISFSSFADNGTRRKMNNTRSLAAMNT